MFRRNFCATEGGALELIEDIDCDVAFGFRVYTHNGLVGITEAHTYASDFIRMPPDVLSSLAAPVGGG